MIGAVKKTKASLPEGSLVTPRGRESDYSVAAFRESRCRNVQTRMGSGGRHYGSEHDFGKAAETAALLVVGRLFQQNAGYERCRGGEQPFDPPHLDRLELRQIRCPVDQTDDYAPGHAG
jgi:hypothetical protein